MATKETKPAIFFFGFPEQGHLNPILQLANILFDKGFAITIIHTEFNPPNSSQFPKLDFISIPDGLSKSEASNPDHFELLHHLNSKCIAPFTHCLKKLLSANTNKVCVILDAFWYFTDSVTEKLGIPRIVVNTINLSAFVAFSKYAIVKSKGYIQSQGMDNRIMLNFHFPTNLDFSSVFSIAESQLDSKIPELPYLRMKDIPDIATQERISMDKLLNGVFRALKTSSGIIFNTVEDLESDLIDEAVKEFPLPIFCIGPFHKHILTSSSSLLTQDMTCLSWLDKQEPNSVIYVSIGSQALIDETEFLETAWGLSNSNQPFLWVVRPGSINSSKWIENLPEGFVENLEGRGKIVKWAPQLEVLAHKATGGFLTHCGWNSTLESICEAVPMICRPFFGDQKTNARCISDVWRIGIHLENKIEKKEIENAIRTLFRSSEGEEMRKRITQKKVIAEDCLKLGGSSYKSLDKLVTYLLSI